MDFSSFFAFFAFGKIEESGGAIFRAEGPKNGPAGPPKLRFLGFLGHFWDIFGTFLGHFWDILGWFLSFFFAFCQGPFPKAPAPEGRSGNGVKVRAWEPLGAGAWFVYHDLGSFCLGFFGFSLLFRFASLLDG